MSTYNAEYQRAYRKGNTVANRMYQQTYREGKRLRSIRQLLINTVKMQKELAWKPAERKP